MKRFIYSMVIAFVVLLSTGIDVSAYSTGDDYPSEYKNYALDTVIDRWNFYNRECTSFVAWCMESRNGVFLHNWSVTVDGVSHSISNTVQDSINSYGQKLAHAKYWGTAFQSMGFPVNNTPAVGSIAWSNSGTYGHVAWVKAVNGDGTVTIEQYNNTYVWSTNTYLPRGCFSEDIRPVSAFTGFIHVKDLTPANNPKGVVDIIEGGNGRINVRGWAFDEDDVNQSIEIHVYIGGPSVIDGEGHTAIFANQERPDVNSAYGISGNHGFDTSITTERIGS